MLKLCKLDKNRVLIQINNKVLDGIVASNSNLIDDIILSMKHEGILECLNNGFPDRRRHNSFIPLNFIMALAIASKMKSRMSLTDIPFAIRDHRTLAELGYAAINTTNENGWLKEGTIRHLLGKYEWNDLFDYYNDIVQKHIFKTNNIRPNIHILDCTKIKVNIDNENYEESSLAHDHNNNELFRGYKLSSLRGIIGDSGIIEEVRFGTASVHDIELSKDIILNSSCLNAGDILIMDRGFISRRLIKYLKEVKKVNVYIPMKKNMSEYQMALALAEELDDWQPHPTRANQMICHVPNVDSLWQGWDVEDNISLNAVVIWFEGTQSYAVITTTDMSKSAKEIVMTYELRPEIEEDFRQLKDFWKLEDFHSTKLNVISFHIVCVLFGYLFYQLYLTTEDGEKYIGKCLPVVLKNYREEFLNYLVLYSGEYFCVLSLKEFIEFRDNCEEDIKEYILKFLR